MEKILYQLLETYKDKEIELNKTYYVSEWSWNPMCDGYIVSQETIQYVEEINGIEVYTTGTNYRHYYKWDLFEDYNDAKKMSDYKDSFTYDWAKIDNCIEYNQLSYTPDKLIKINKGDD